MHRSGDTEPGNKRVDKWWLTLYEFANREQPQVNHHNLKFAWCMHRRLLNLRFGLNWHGWNF